MYLSGLAIQNARSVAEAHLHLPPHVNLIVGENNSGKSTVLHAALLGQQRLLDAASVRFGTPALLVNCTFNQIEPGFFPGHFDVLRHYRNSGSCSTTISISSQGSEHRVLLLPNGQQHAFGSFSANHPDNLFVPFLSTRRVWSYAENVNESAAFSVSGSFTNLYSRVDLCLTSAELRPLFEQACKDILGFTLTTWPTGGGKTAGLEIDARQRKYISLVQMGAGVAHMVGLIVELLLAERKTFVIEELENDLHPGALGRLLALVERSANDGNQFIISTHSNVVVRRLGTAASSKVFSVERDTSVRLPTSVVTEVTNVPAERWALLRKLGYEVGDYEMYDGWLVLEESSAELLIREFIIPWFTPALVGRVKTIAAQGAADVEPRLIDLQRLITFVHLEPIYRKSAWVLVDGDKAGTAAIESLRSTFSDWPADRFLATPSQNIEAFYPKPFSDQVSAVLAMPRSEERREAKKRLILAVVDWLRKDPQRGREALGESAAPLIQALMGIESVIINKQ